MRIDLGKIEELYTRNVQQYGIDVRSVGWKDVESQHLRFQKLVEVINKREDPFQVNELGCGYGAMFFFLIEAGFKIGQYIGYDISSAMLDAARNLVKDSRAQFIQSDLITRVADYSFASGIFNVKFDIGEEAWKKYIEQILENMSEYSRKGFAFNMLTTCVDFRKDHLFYGDPFYFFDFCKRRFSRKVSLLHDYDLWEWTICVKK